MAPHGSYGVNAALAMVRMVVYGNQCPQGSLGGCRRAATGISAFHFLWITNYTPVRVWGEKKKDKKEKNAERVDTGGYWTVYSSGTWWIHGGAKGIGRIGEPRDHEFQFQNSIGCYGNFLVQTRKKTA